MATRRSHSPSPPRRTGRPTAAPTTPRTPCPTTRTAPRAEARAARRWAGSSAGRCSQPPDPDRSTSLGVVCAVGGPDGLPVARRAGALRLMFRAAARAAECAVRRWAGSSAGCCWCSELHGPDCSASLGVVCAVGGPDGLPVARRAGALRLMFRVAARARSVLSVGGLDRLPVAALSLSIRTALRASGPAVPVGSPDRLPVAHRALRLTIRIAARTARSAILLGELETAPPAVPSGGHVVEVVRLARGRRRRDTVVYCA